MQGEPMLILMADSYAPVISAVSHVAAENAAALRKPPLVVLRKTLSRQSNLVGDKFV